MVAVRVKVAAPLHAKARLALMACSGCSTEPSNRPSLVGTYDVQMTTDIAAELGLDSRTVGIFILADQHDDGEVAGSYTLAVAGSDAPVNVQPSSGTLTGSVTEGGSVTLTVHSRGFTDVLLTGTRSADGNISGMWGQDVVPFEQVGTFVLSKR